MSVYNLPPIDTAGLVDPDRPGRWTPLADLGRLANALKIEKDDVDPDEIKSIPDAWAQIQLVNDALFDRSHEAHDSVLSQWRAMLALFALQPTYRTDYSLNITSVEIVPERWLRATRGRGAEDLESDEGWRSRLHRVLALLAPQGGACNLDWGKIGLVEFVATPSKAKHRSLGMLSPLTLVAPGRTAGSFRHSLPWLKNGLTDPLRTEEMRAEAWPVLANFLADLAAAVERVQIKPTGQPDRTEKLLLALNRFRKECAERAGETHLDPAPLPNDKWPQDFFKQLGKSYRKKPDSAKLSDCLLRLRSKAAGGLFTGVILADPALAETLGRPAHQIRIWNDHTLLEAASADSLATIRAEAEAQGYAVVTPDDFFSDELVRMGSGASVSTHGPGLKDKLLPLSPIALLCSTAETGLGEAVTLTGSDAEFQVSLTVELSERRENAHIKHALKRDYGSGKVVDMLPPDDLGLWPDFGGEAWPWTFLRYQYDPANDLQIRFGLTPEVIVADVARGKQPRDKSARLADWASNASLGADSRIFGHSDTTMYLDGHGRPLIDRVRFVETSSLIAEQHQLYRGVEAIFFARRRNGGDVPVGCVAVNRPVRAVTKSATVSIDFGTSNTVAYYRQGREQPQRLSFKNRVVFPIEHELDETLRATAYADFFPLVEHDTPLPTVMKGRDFEGNLSSKLLSYIEDVSKQNAADPANQLRSILGVTHMLFFMPRLGPLVSPEILVKQINSGLLRFDLKWEEGSEASFIISCYLRQLMIMIAAEMNALGVRPSAIQWRFSYPQAFNSVHAARFRSVVKSLAVQLEKEAGSDRASAAPTLLTEGEAAANYFTDDPAQEGSGVAALLLMLDIGGGTTDMAIRCDKRLVWRGSVKLAGSDFFRNYLVNNLAILERIDPETVSLFKAKAADAHDPEVQLRQLVDLLVAKPSFSSAFDKQYDFHAPEPAWAGLRHAAAAALGGMMHYLGLVLKELIEAGLIPESRLDDLSVALGGRGSTIFRQFAALPPQNSELARLCRLAAASGGADPAAVRVLPLFSKSPKEEVARGLLIDRAADTDATRQPDRRLPSGLAVTISHAGKNEMLPANAEASGLLQADRIEAVDMTEFETFIKRLRDQTGLTIDIAGEGAVHTIRNIARHELTKRLDARQRSEATNDGQEADKESQAIEPPFVTALRALVKLMSAPIETRGTMLKVWQKEQ